MMNKAYEIFVTLVTADNGRFAGYKRIALTLDKEKIESIIENFRAEHEKYEFWMHYETEKVNGKSRIAFRVEEVEVV